MIESVDPATGGPIEGVRQMGRINRELGHVIEIASLDDPRSPCVEALELPVHARGPGRTHFAYAPGLVPWLRANASRYDCVVVNGIWGFNCVGAWWALRGTGVPYVVYTHGMLDPWFKRTFPLKHLRKWLLWPWAVYPSLRDAFAVLFTCEEERRLARQSFWLYSCNEIVVNYGTPGAPEAERDYAGEFLDRHPTLRGKRRFVFLGRVNPKKGPDVLIRAVARLRDEGQWDAAIMRVILAGPADGAYVAELKALADELGVADCLYWTGMLRGDDKWGALQCGEAFVLPSHQENFGIAVAESLSVGVPVLISKSVNIWADIIADGAGLAEDDTVDGCTELLRRWLDLPHAEQAAMRERARECFLNRYTSARAAESLRAAVTAAIEAAAVKRRR